MPFELQGKHISKIFVTFEREGIHYYPQALTDPTLNTPDNPLTQVDFLSSPHRHIFKFRVEISVNHNDRDLEFIQEKRYLQTILSEGTPGPYMFGAKSCEMIAEELYEAIQHRYAGRTVTIEVSEDGENGAIVTFNPHNDYAEDFYATH